jgi:hypothetical protein
MAQPRTQNRAEGVFSIASGEFRAGKRNTKAHMWSAIVRKKNVDNLRMRETIRKNQFISMFSKCLAFGRNNKSEIKAIYTPDLAESEQKFEARMKKDLPQFAQAGGAFEKTNICDAAESRNVLRAQDRNGGSVQNKRHRGVADDQRGDGSDLRLESGAAGTGKSLRLKNKRTCAGSVEKLNQPSLGSIKREGQSSMIDWNSEFHFFRV